MRKCLFVACLMSLLFINTRCSDFLEESSQDEVRPSTVEELEQLMLGEAYLRTSPLLIELESMTDNVQSAWSEYYSSTVEQYAPAFTWQFNMFERMEELGVSNGLDTWETLYSKIKGCNVTLDMLDKVDGSEANKLNQRGQALALRGFYYLLLVNTFAEPYNKEGIDLDKAMGVPLILESAVKDEFPSRASIGAVYAQIEKDLLEAAKLMDEYGKDNIRYKVTPLFVYTLLSRMYLYMEDWEASAKYASIVLDRNPQLRRLSDFATEEMDPFGMSMLMTYDLTNGGVLNYESPEFIYGYADSRMVEIPYQSPSVGDKPPFFVSDELLALYEEGDIRPVAYYNSYLISMFPWITSPLGGRKSDIDGNPYASTRGFRTAESYLNRAESNIRLFLEKGDDQLRKDALADLNYLREHRFQEPYTDVDITDGKELLDFCLDERRRELAFEEMRWFDLRRLGMPQLQHTITLVEGQPQIYTLPQGSNRYTLPIPQKVMDKNPALIQNPE